MREPFLALERLEKRFGATRVLRDLSLAVAEGEILALLGPSGSGKTTLLRLLAGFETADSGSIRVAGAEVAHLPPAARGFGMVFQHYALFPHLSVGDNVAFGLTGRSGGAPRTSPAEVAARVAEMLALVDLDGFEQRRPGEISGGQQQRVALARALAPGPRLLLLDEPLSNLDPALRERTRRELRKAIRRVGITTVLVTHEQEEAFDLGDRVAVLSDGVLDQVGAPETLYREPATRFVATFVGPASVRAGRLAAAPGEGGRAAMALDAGGEGAAPVEWSGVAAPGAERLGAGAAVELVVRPEALALVQVGGGEKGGGEDEEELGRARQAGAAGARAAAGGGGKVGDGGSAGAAGPDGAPAVASLAGRVVQRRYAGPISYYAVRLDGGTEVEVLAAESAGAPLAAEGDRVRVTLSGRGPAPRIFAAGGSPGSAVPRATQPLFSGPSR